MEVTGTPTSGESASNNLKPSFKKGATRGFNPGKESALNHIMKGKSKCPRCKMPMNKCKCKDGDKD